MTRKQWVPAVLIFCVVLLFPPSAHANAMVPIIVTGWFGMFLALVPIILIECVVLTRAGADIWGSLLAMSAANMGSTLAGIPLAIALEIVVVAGTPFYDESWDPKDTWFREWMLPAGALLLLVPFFLMSWWIEAPIAAWILDDLPTQFVDSAVRDANLVTYGILAALLSTVLVMAIWSPSHASTSRAGLEPASELADPWRFANEQARRGIAGLRAKEDEIGSLKPVQPGTDSRDELALDREKAA
jgi:hypothetical protein